MCAVERLGGKWYNECMTKNYYTYLIKYPNFKLYHGSRGCDGAIEHDHRYMGSSQYTPKGGVKEILTTHSSREEAFAEEIRYHWHHGVKNNPLFYNRANLTTTGFSCAGIPLSEEKKLSISIKNSGENNGMYGTNHTDEAREAIGVASRGERNPMYGKKHSAEIRAKMSAAGSGKNHRCYSPEIFHWQHRDGREEKMPMYEFRVKYGLNKGCTSQVKNGKRPSIKGWMLYKD